MVAVAVIGSSVVGAVGQAVAGSAAAKAQTQAADKSSETQLKMFNTMRDLLAPYTKSGVDTLSVLNRLMGTGKGGNPLTSFFKPVPYTPVTMTQRDLMATPGYQFTRAQGLQAVQNSAAARGLGISGAAMKDAAGYATGLADSTYNQQFANAMQSRQQTFSNSLTNQNNMFNRLMSMMQTGESAAAGTGAAGVQTGQSIGQNIIGAGNAQAANYMNMGNAFSGVANQVGGLYTTNALMKGMGMGSMWG